MFKLNAHWLHDDDYVALVHKIWKYPHFLTKGDRKRRLVWRLKVLKTHTKLWYKAVCAKNKAQLETLESDIKETIVSLVVDSTNMVAEKLLQPLERERNNVLRGVEEQGRLPSRVILIKSEDNNTKYFYKVASHSRIQKHVWEIIDGNGYTLTDHGVIKEEAISYFKKFYKDRSTLNTIKQVKVTDLFPKMVNEDESSPLFNLVTMEELKVILFQFKKDKSPRPDSWTTEFFTLFFDLVGEDVLEMVEDSRLKGSIVGSLNSTFLTLIPKANKPVYFDDFHSISLCNLCYKVI
jgi:hypothetical protein